MIALLLGCVLIAGVDEDTTEAYSQQKRYALMISASRGDRDESALLYASRDAARLGAILSDLGGFESQNIRTIEESTADQVRAEIDKLAARFQHEPNVGAENLLLVYYSGHADAQALHLSGTRLPWTELRSRIAAVPVRTRLLIVDACQSGAATQVKGTRVTRPMALPAAESALPAGFAIVSSAAAGEAAYESDALQASFFTHHLVSALAGVADRDNDGRVNLHEAFDYAAERTLSSSARTLSGVQHATYDYQLRGRESLVLTEFRRNRMMGSLRLNAPGRYFVRRHHGEGAVVAEAAVGTGTGAGRYLTLAPGTYFVQHRMRKRFAEGVVTLDAGTTTDLDNVELKSVEYAQLTRKGGRSLSHAASLWGGVGSPAFDGFPVSYDALIQFSFALPELTVDLQFGHTHAVVEGPLTTRLHRARLETAVRRVFDLDPVSISTGAAVGLEIYLESHSAGTDDATRTDDRRSVAPTFGLVARIDLPLPEGYFIGLHTQANIRPLVVQSGLEADETERTWHPDIKGSAGVGKYW